MQKGFAHTGLAVVEARWWPDGNHSVRPLFETLAGIVDDNPHAVRYDMFVEEISLTKIVAAIAKAAYIHSIYVAAHGDETSIHGLSEAISRTVLRNILRNHNKNETISGLYFGSCLICTPKNAGFWLAEEQATGLKWIAGYSKTVNWIDSSAVDMIFWAKYLSERKANRSRKRGKKSELDIVKYASSEVKELMPTIFSQLGFNIYYRDTGGALTPVW